MTSRRQAPLQIAEADPRTCSHDTRIRALARVPFFTELRASALADVEGLSAMRGVVPDEVIFRAGELAKRLYVVAQGVVRLSRPAPDGGEVLLDLAGTGDYVGVLPALGADHHPDNARALTPACLLSFDNAAFSAVLDRYPQVARAALPVVGGRLRRAQDAIHRLASATAEQRLAATVVLLAERLGMRREDAVIINAPLSRDDLASMAGCAPETASRVLARWRRDGIIDAGRRWIAVRDRAALEGLAAG